MFIFTITCFQMLMSVSKISTLALKTAFVKIRKARSSACAGKATFLRMTSALVRSPVQKTVAWILVAVVNN